MLNSLFVTAFLISGLQIVAQPPEVKRAATISPRMPIPEQSSTLPNPRNATVGPSSVVRAELARQTSVKKCLYERGKFVVQVRGLSLTATGSDVDQIYGRIYARADTVPLGVISGDMPGWDAASMWNSLKSYNLGKFPLRGTGTAFGRGEPFDRGTGTSLTTISVFFSLFDEDGAHGGSDDEFFYVNNHATRYSSDNGVATSMQIPSCQDAPSFDRQRRFQVVGSPRGGAGSNTIVLTAEARIVRTF